MTLGSSNDPRGAGSLMEAGWQGAWAWAGPVASPAPRPHCQPLPALALPEALGQPPQPCTGLTVCSRGCQAISQAGHAQALSHLGPPCAHEEQLSCPMSSTISPAKGAPRVTSQIYLHTCAHACTHSMSVCTYLQPRTKPALEPPSLLLLCCYVCFLTCPEVS